MVLDKIITIIRNQLLWKPKDNSLYRAFSRSIEHSLKRKEYLETQDKFRKWFFDKHAGWTVTRLNEIFTPRARNTYKMKLTQLYQDILALQPTHMYKVPGRAFPPALARDELPDELRGELEGTDSSDSEERDAVLDTVEGQSLLALPGAVADGSSGGPLVPSPVAGRRVGFSGAAALPALPGAVGAAAPALPEPREAAQEWLQLLDKPEDDNMTMSQAGQGFGPFASLLGRAWLASARRRVMMKELAENWGHELEKLEYCEECGRQEDPLVLSGLGDGQAGLGLKICVVSDIPALISEFEQAYSVPEFPFQDDVWRAFLERSDSWKTLCSRCRAAQMGALAASSTPASQRSRPAVPPPALSDSSPGSDQPTPDESPDDDDGTPEDEDDDVPAEWNNVQVSMSSREQLLYWASMAKKRVARRQEWEAHKEMEEEDGREPRQIRDTLQRAARNAEDGGYSDEELRTESDSQSRSGSGSGSGSRSGSGSYSGSRSGSGSFSGSSYSSDYNRRRSR